MFLCKTTADAHKDMGRETYETFFREHFLTNLTPNSVIVVDNLSYHRCKKKLSTKSLRKDQINEWLNVHYPIGEYLTKKYLMNIFNSESSKYGTSKTMEHGVSRLPIYYCELNPIMVGWRQIKHHVPVINTQLKTNVMGSVLFEGFYRANVENWR